MENGVCQALGMEERWELTPCWIWSNANVPEEAVVVVVQQCVLETVTCVFRND